MNNGYKAETANVPISKIVISIEIIVWMDILALVIISFTCLWFLLDSFFTSGVRSLSHNIYIRKLHNSK